MTRAFRVSWVGLPLVLALAACQAGPLGAFSKGVGAKASPMGDKTPAGQAPAALPGEAASKPALAGPKPGPGPSPLDARPEAIASRPEGSASQAAAPSALAGLSAKAQYAIPARANLPLPSGLLGPGAFLLGSDGAKLLANDGGGVIANQGLALLANDGGSLLANDGGGLLANDGGGLLANDGGGIVAGGAGNLRLLQASLAEGLGLEVPTAGRMQLKGVFPIVDQESPALFAQGQVLLYALQAASLNVMLEELGKRHWRPQVPVYLERLMPGAPASEVSRFNAEVGPGPSGSGPVFWVYNAIGAHMARLKEPTKALGLRPATPDMALQITGKGTGRVFWMPGMATPSDQLAFASDFDLPRKRVDAELVAIADGASSAPGLRRVRWRFEGDPDGGLRILVHTQAEGPGVVAARACRRLMLHAAPTGAVRVVLSQGPSPEALAWSSANGQGTSPTPQAVALTEAPFLDLAPQAELQALPSLDFGSSNPWTAPMPSGPPADLGRSVYLSWPTPNLPPQSTILLPSP